MKKEYRDAWVQALRSGEYSQARGALNRYKRYCCLGVLADLMIKHQWFPELNVRWEDEYPLMPSIPLIFTPIGKEDKKCKINTIGIIHSDLSNELGLSADFQQEVAELNDYKDFSFKQIADYIEQNLKD